MNLVRDRKNSVLTALVHVVEPQLYQLMRKQEILSQQPEAFRLEFFNVFESGVRALWNEYPPLACVPKDGHADFVIIGLGRMGETLVLHAARDWLRQQTASSGPIRVHVIDRIAARKTEALKQRYPYLMKACEIVPYEFDLGHSPELHDLFASKRFNPCAVYVCLDDDSFGLSLALTVHRLLEREGIPIFVRMATDSGLAQLLRGETGSPDVFPNLHSFGSLERTCNPELLLMGTHEVLARAVHEYYVRKEQDRGRTAATNVSLVSWEDLDEQTRESNRRHADHIGIKLRAAGCSIMPLYDYDYEPFSFTQEEVNLLARMEHQRWRTEKESQGWRFAPQEKDSAAKTHPDLVEFDDLSAESKEKNRDMIQDIPAILAQCGFRIYRRR
jgi:hypothetical protein